MKAALAQADSVVGTMGPVLRHLLANEDHSLFSDEIVARVRGMIGDVARQLLLARTRAAEDDDAVEYAAQWQESLFGRLLDQASLLGHAHALALEAQLTRSMQENHGIDAVLTPLLQSLVAAKETAPVAMAALAGQARFVQQQRRMELPLGELPGDMLHGALQALRSLGDENADPLTERACASLRKNFDEGRSRVALMTQLVMGPGKDTTTALSIAHAGVAFFTTALAIGSGQDRSLAILATHDRQKARLILALRAAGLDSAAIIEQFTYFHPESNLPAGIDGLQQNRAATLLADTNPYLVG